MTRGLGGAALLLFLAACGEDPDFDGLYRVESNTLATGSCDAPGDELERVMLEELVGSLVP